MQFFILTKRHAVLSFLYSTTEKGLDPDRMAFDNWDVLVWRRAGNLRQQAERIQRNFLQMAVGAQYRVQQGSSAYWEPPVNVIDTEESLWVISAVPGVTVDNVTVRLDGRE